ncbi:MAG: NAD(P) transhydrogenase subunit alpha [Spirochaetota bacterium]|nr:NAD(P) transhydrogenase subunit alpha [Spirochaetota bacterium]
MILSTVNQNSQIGTEFILIITVFMLAIFVGFEVITKVPPLLHTPLMSGSNAISGIAIVGAIVAAGISFSKTAALTIVFGQYSLAHLMGFLAVVFAAINVVGGFLVTHRMLDKFKKKG